MKNFIQKGEALELTAPVGGVESGKVYKIGDIIVVAAVSAEAGQPFQGVHEGVFQFNKGALVVTEGLAVDWDIATSSIVATTTGDFALGYVTKAAGAGVAVAEVLLK